MFFIFTKDFKINFQTRKWNYVFHFWTINQKTIFTECFSLSPRNSKFIFKTRNKIIQTGNGIFSLTFRHLIKKLLLQHLLHINQGVQNLFSKREMELSKQEMELFLPIPGLWSKNFFYIILFISTKKFKPNPSIPRILQKVWYGWCFICLGYKLSEI